MAKWQRWVPAWLRRSVRRPLPRRDRRRARRGLPADFGPRWGPKRLLPQDDGSSGGQPREPGWRPAPEPPSELLVIDCAGVSEGTQIVSLLDSTPVRYVRENQIRPARALLLLLPIHAGPGTPADLVDLAGDLEAMSELAPSDIRVVVAWYVEEAARLRLAKPHGERGWWNAMGLLVGTAWRREMAAHDGDPAAAVACRGDRVRAMLDAPNNQFVGGARPQSIHRYAERLDPHMVVTLCTQVSARHADEKPRWTGEEGVAAAVRVRLAIR